MSVLSLSCPNCNLVGEIQKTDFQIGRKVICDGCEKELKMKINPLTGNVILEKASELNEEYFNNFKNTLRNHQNEALEAIKGQNIGQINLPTGTGKTYIQKCIHIEDMIQKTKNNQVGVYVIAAHRLSLCTQLFNEVIDLLIHCGVESDFIYVGSERYNFDKLNKKYQPIIGRKVESIDGEQTTSSFAVKEMVNQAKKNNRHCLIVSTYHSFNRLNKLDNIDIVTFDESHTTTSDQFTTNIAEVKPIIKRQFYFTATKKGDGESRGQNNEEFYGKTLYEMFPVKAIELGEIVGPRLHTIESRVIQDINSRSNETMIVATVMDAFKEHKKRVSKPFDEIKQLGAKMLITVDGLDELKTICENETFQNFCDENKIKVFSFSSRPGEGSYYNFKSIQRQMALERMNEMDIIEDSIMLHYDILTEGIDLPAITGVLILRDLGTIKLMQNIGRSARLIQQDRERIYKNEISPNEYNKLVKPCCWIIVPEYLSTLNDSKKIKDMIKKIREEYKIIFEKLGEDDKALADQEHNLPNVTKKDKSNSKDKTDELNHKFENIILEIIFEDIVKELENGKNGKNEMEKFKNEMEKLNA